MIPETSKHHLLYPKRYYKTPVERKLRCDSGLIFPMIHTGHRELHANVRPPLKLTREQMLGSIGITGEMRTETLHDWERVVELGLYLASRSIREGKVADNLFAQAEFIHDYGVPQIT